MAEANPQREKGLLQNSRVEVLRLSYDCIRHNPTRHRGACVCGVVKHKHLLFPVRSKRYTEGVILHHSHNTNNQGIPQDFSRGIARGLELSRGLVVYGIYPAPALKKKHRENLFISRSRAKEQKRILSRPRTKRSPRKYPDPVPAQTRPAILIISRMP